ncbi:starch synthase [Lutibacter oricola]|uniref:Glycogen synthase n=1 Tax=Lutibacter oricola TaxID=762486 RepID=A0A1H2X7Z4_9FLAO|nr:glycogen/starch synthase [Lutibacter oricola]SDW88876.1 starch synthase [Lutibacter oricola]
MKILHISAECYPIAKVGGLADVVGSLPKYQNNQNVTSEVIMPYYNNKFTNQNEFKSIYEGKVNLDVNEYEFRILTPTSIDLGYNLFLVDIPELLFKDYVYSNDDTERFFAFQLAVLNWVTIWENKPTTLHCHDHHTGLIPFLISESYVYSDLKDIPTVFTIHNAQYQGWFSHDKVNMFPEFNFDHVGLLDWGGSINPLAAAIKCAWKVNTVSPSYMEELKFEANGLEHLLSAESEKCVGILNGIDTDVWNPETDSYLIKNYKTSTVQSGSKENKKWLCNEFNLDEKKPLFAFIGRLVGEKGSDLFPEVFRAVLEKNECNILLLGSGNNEVENALNELKGDFEGTYNAFIGYDERLSHIIYAGADFLLMPSRVEPCGLNQMYSLRYGTIPVVRSIGGLKDTVIDISKENGFGICHNEVNKEEIVTAIDRAVELYKNQTAYKKHRKNIMSIDHSWGASAKEYINLYQNLKTENYAE